MDDLVRLRAEWRTAMDAWEATDAGDGDEAPPAWLKARAAYNEAWQKYRAACIARRKVGA